MKKYYLVVEDNRVINTVVCTEDFQIPENYVEYQQVAGAPGIGWTRNEDGTFSPPIIEESQEIIEE